MTLILTQFHSSPVAEAKSSVACTRYVTRLEYSLEYWIKLLG